MNFIDYAHRKIPDYYDTMYLDGFEPWEIEVAFRKKMQKIIDERLAQRKAQQEKIENIKITSEIKIK